MPSNARRSLPSLVRLNELFAYDRTSGLLSYRKGNHRVRAGDEAGSIDSYGYVTVCVDGRYFAGHSLAWMLGHQRGVPTDAYVGHRRPDHPLYDAASPADQRAWRYELRASLSLDNLELRYPRKRPPSAARPLSGVQHRDVAQLASTGMWQVKYPVPVYAGDAKYVVQEFTRVNEALDFYADLCFGIDFIRHHPMPPLSPGMAAMTPNAVPLITVHGAYAYNPASGHFYHRAPERMVGMRADAPYAANRNKGRFIHMGNRRWPAHMVAWFLTHGTWPARKSIVHKDGDITNNRLSNLELRA